MANSVVFPRAQFFSNSGRPLVGGRIHTYVAGSSTRARTYKDAAKAQLNANPIILDARGEASVYLAEGVEYKFVIEDSTGALIMTQEPVYGAVWPNAAAWPSDATLSYQYMTEARAAAIAAGPIKFFDTKAQADAAIGTMANGDIIEVSQDETRANARTRYKVQAGALVFVVNLDQTRLDLAATTGSALVGFQQAGAGSVARTLQGKLRDSVSVKDFGAVGDGVTDDTAAIGAAATYAATANRSILLTGETYIVTTLTLNVDAHFVGTGTIRKKPGTIGHLISSTANLKIDGDITLDQNAANCPNDSATSSSDCAVSHSGQDLVLVGVTIPTAVGVNVRSSATRLLRMLDCRVSGGWMCLLGTTGVNCKVEIIRGDYGFASKDDSIQIHNSLDVLVDGVSSHDAGRSGIVVSASVQNCRIVNNKCYNNKIDGVNQGGWGIVCSVSVAYTVVSGNTCRNNQRGPITIDTYTSGLPDNTTDAWINVTGNICDGEYNGGYSTTGIAVNGAKQVNVSGNRIRKVAQGMLCVGSKTLNVSGNAIEDCSTYFVQFHTCDRVTFIGNTLNGCSFASAAHVQVFTCAGVTIRGNDIYNMTGTGSHVFRISDTSDYLVADNTAIKTDAGSGWGFQLTGTQTRGRITGNKFKSSTTGWQYYIVATDTTVSDVVTERNEIIVSGIQTNPQRYVLNGAAIVGDGDTINGIRDRFSAAPTAWTFRQGYIAINNNVAQFWNGTAWVTI